MMNLNHKCGEFFFPDGDGALWKTAVRLSIFAMVFWAIAIQTIAYVNAKRYEAMGANEAEIEARRDGIPANAVILAQVDGVMYDSSLVVKNLDLKQVKSKALRDYMTLKLKECVAKAPPQTPVWVPVAGGLQECWINNQLLIR